MTNLNNSNSHIWDWKGLKVSWTKQGLEKQEGIATVLIHGFGACKEHWRYNQTIYGSIAPSYAIDLIGFGESSQPIARHKNELNKQDGFVYCFDNWSQQIAGFCNEIIQGPVLIIGNSIGGVIALRAAELLQENCIGIVLINCAQRTMDDKRLAQQNIGMRLTRPLLKKLVSQRWLSNTIFHNVARPIFIEKILTIAYPTGNNINSRLIDMLYKPTQRKGASEAFRGFINLFDDYLAPEIMKNLKTNVYLIWGEKDPWEPLEEARIWFKSFKCIKSLDIINECGHCPHDENPEKVNSIIIKKIQEAM